MKKFLIKSAVILAVCVFGVVLFRTFYYIPSDEIPLSVSGEKVQVLSEQAVKKIDRDISSIENELKNDFYKSLRKRVWTPDKAAPGNKYPFTK